RPKRCAACRTKAAASASRSMCASTNTTSPPLAASSAATPLPRSASRSAKATVAPSVTNRRTVASPIPEAPPVTAATFPFSRAMFDDLSLPSSGPQLLEAAGRESVDRDLRVPTEDEIGEGVPHGGTVEDALASAARGHVHLIESGHTAEHEQPVGCHRTQAGCLLRDLRVRHRGQHPEERGADLIAGCNRRLFVEACFFLGSPR